MRAATRLRLLFAIVVVAIAPCCLLPSASADPTTSAYYEQIVKADSPAAYWRMSETSGTTINDTSVNNRDGLWYDPLYTGRTPSLGVSGVPLLAPNLAVRFDGSASQPFGEVSSAGLNPASFSVEAWVKPTDLPDPYTYGGDDSKAIICSRDYYDKKGYMLYLGAYGPNAQFAFNAGDNKQPPAEKNLIVATAPAIQSGQWYHVVATISGSANPDMHLYVNGVNRGVVQHEEQFYPNDTGTYTLIGKGSRYNSGTGVNSNEYSFSGALDEVAVYGRALSEAEVFEHYSQGVAMLPENVDPPTISAATIEGQQLQVTGNGSWSGTQPFSYSYHWQRCGASCNDISGATSGSYTLTTSDIGQTIRLRVTATNVAGPTSEVSDETDPIDPRQLLNTSLPTISGEARDTRVLTGSLGSWSGSGQIHLHYQWQSCVGATHGDCDPIGDLTDVDYPHSADDVKYKLTSEEVGRTIELQVTADDDYGSGSVDKWSARTAVVLGSVPVSTSLPTIEGILETDETLTGHDADWIGTEPFTSTEFQWLRCSSASDCSPMSSETSETYQLKKADIGYLFELQVTKTNDYGSTVATSAQTAAVQPVRPTNLSPPTITGTAKDGLELQGDKGSWKGTADLIYVYQWLRCDEAVSSCAGIDGATSETYRLQKADIGSKIVFRVAVTNDYGTESADSDPTTVVEPSPPENKTLPTIAGLVRDGATLTAWEGEWNGTVPITYTFQWRLCDENGANCSDITGATTTKYTVTTADIGHTIRVQVTAKNVTNAEVIAVSPATGAATAEPLRNTARPVVTGSAMVGQILSTTDGSWNGSLPIDHYFHWLRCDSYGNACSKIEGATEKSYRVAGPDINHRLRAEELAANAAGQFTVESEPTEIVSPWVSSESDYAIQLTATPDDVLPSASVVYEVKVRNSRSSSIYIDHLNITLPEGFSFVPGSTRGDVTLAPVVDGRTLGWSGAPEVAAGKTASFQFDVQAGGVGGTFTSDLAATVQSLEPLTLTKVAPVTVETEPALKLTSDVEWVPVGGSATFTGTVFNPTPDPLPVSGVSVILPTGLEYKSGSASLGTPDIVGELLRWNNVTAVPARDREQFTFVAKSVAAKNVYTVTSEVTLEAGELTESAGKPNQPRVSASGKKKTLVDAAQLSSAAKDSLARKFRPYLYFDHNEAWRPLNVAKFLSERDTNDRWKQKVCFRTGGFDFCTDQSDSIAACPKPSADNSLDWTQCNPTLAMKYLIDTGVDFLNPNNGSGFYVDFSNDYNAPDLRKCDKDAKRLKGGLCDHNDGTRAKYYYHATKDGSDLYLDYYVFYRYNNPHSEYLTVETGVDWHEGDWEGLLIKTAPKPSELPISDENLPDSNTSREHNALVACERHDVEWVAFHAHQGLYRYGCEALRWADTTHVEAFVAESTHATYPQRCNKKHCYMNKPVANGYDSERGFDGKKPWGENKSEQCAKDKCLQTIDLPEGKMVGDPFWAFWKGNWSGSNPKDTVFEKKPGTAIFGPGAKGDYFNHPWREVQEKVCERTVFNGGPHGYDLCNPAPQPKCGFTCINGVPSVVGMNVRNAKKKLEDEHLNIRVIEKIKANKKKNVVYKQTPKTGTVVAMGYWVTITVATRDEIPNLSGMDWALARKTLIGKDHKLKVSGKKKEYDEKVEKGRVTRTVPKKGTDVVPGDKVVIWISKGAKPKLPDVRGSKPGKAKKKIEGAPWRVTVNQYKTGSYSNYAEGTIERTEPSQGTRVGEGEKVTFYLSKGEPKLKDVRGWKPGDAESELEGSPWHVKVVHPYETGGNSSYCPGTIVRTNPAQGKEVSRGRNVAFYLSRGKANGKNKNCVRHQLASALRQKTRTSQPGQLGSIASRLAWETRAKANSIAGWLAPATREMAGSSSSSVFLTSSTSTDTCGNWFGPLVVALACNESILSEAKSEDFRAGGTFAMDVEAGGTVAAAGPGYAQALGSVLEPGDAVSLYGTASSGTRLGIRLATSDGGMAEALFDDVGLEKGGRDTLEVRDDGSDSKKDGVPDARLQIGSRVVRPSIVLVRPGSPRLLALKSTKKGLRIRFKATGVKTGIEISGKKAPIASFSIPTRISRTKQIVVPLGARRPKTISLASYGSQGTVSDAVVATRPGTPRLLALRRTSRGLVIRFVAKTKTTRIKVYGARGKRIALRSPTTKPGAKRKIVIRIKSGVPARSIALVSCGRYGFNSLPLVRRVR